MCARLPDGRQRREHFELATRQLGYEPAEAVGPDCPPVFETVWSWFCDLDQGRGSNGFGPSGLSYAEIAAWRTLTGQRPSVFELGLIRALDARFLQHRAESAPSTGKTT